jgi:hypothetical protein
VFWESNPNASEKFNRKSALLNSVHQNAHISSATTFIDGITDVLQIMLLASTLLWTIVKIAQALKDFHGEE